jgi:hypothetical protein
MGQRCPFKIGGIAINKIKLFNWDQRKVNKETVSDIFKASVELLESGKKYNIKIIIEELPPKERGERIQDVLRQARKANNQ